MASADLEVPSGTLRLQGLRRLSRVTHQVARVTGPGALLWRDAPPRD